MKDGPSALTLPFTPALWVLAAVAIAGLICWMKRKPKAVTGYRDGNATYGYTIEWPFAYLTIVLLVLLHSVASRDQMYLAAISKNRSALADLGKYLLLTIGALAFRPVGAARVLKILCLSLGAAGVVFTLAFRWSY